MSEPALTVETPPSFVLSEEAHKAAYESGFRIPLETRNGWIGYRSTTAQGEVWIARSTAPGQAWLLSLTHTGVIAEIRLPTAQVPNAPGVASYAFPILGDLYVALDRAYKLGVSLPDAPLAVFEKATADLPRSTEVERLVIQRKGQDIFRDALMDYWNCRCPMTGITEPALLRASHIVAWADCETDALRLNVHNGLLLSALWDAAFDAGVISFSDDGEVLRSPALSDAAASALDLETNLFLTGLTPEHAPNLARHRARHGF